MVTNIKLSPHRLGRALPAGGRRTEISGTDAPAPENSVWNANPQRRGDGVLRQGRGPEVLPAGAAGCCGRVSALRRRQQRIVLGFPVESGILLELLHFSELHIYH